MRGQQPGPFICHRNLKPYTRLELVTQLKKQLARLQYDVQQYNNHSFRIGKATDMSMMCFGVNNQFYTKVYAMHLLSVSMACTQKTFLNGAC